MDSNYRRQLTFHLPGRSGCGAIDPQLVQPASALGQTDEDAPISRAQSEEVHAAVYRLMPLLNPQQLPLRGGKRCIVVSCLTDFRNEWKCHLLADG